MSKEQILYYAHSGCYFDMLNEQRIILLILSHSENISFSGNA